MYKQSELDGWLIEIAHVDQQQPSFSRPPGESERQ